MNEKTIINFKGLTILIENPVNSIREGVDAFGKSWRTKFFYPYGYIYNTVGKDGDGVDCFIGNNPTSDRVFIIHQTDGNGIFDEDKVMLGFSSKEEARDAYLAHYNTQGYMGKVIEMPFFEFKTKMLSKEGKEGKVIN